jgi:hypothetical protein
MSGADSCRHHLDVWLRKVLCKVEQQGLPAFGIIQFVDGGRRIMPLLQVALSLIVVGVLLWLVNSFIPMASSIKSILNAVVVIVVVVWLLNGFGLMNSIQNFRLGRN